MTLPAARPNDEEILRINDLQVVSRYAALLPRNNLDSLDALFAVRGESLAKPGLATWRERIRLTLDDRGQTSTLYLKRFRRPPAAARREVRSSGSGASSIAGVEWEWMHRLAADGIPCVRPVAFGEELEGSHEQRSAILTEAAPGCSLELWMADRTDVGSPTARFPIHSTAALVARLHDRGYIHRDLYLSHIFFDPQAPPERSVHLIDLQRVIRPQWMRRRWIVKDLASLNFSTPVGVISASDRLRWLKLYLGLSKLGAAGKALVYRVLGKTRQIQRHHQRRALRLGRA